jgi:NADH-quinone oxidoreductase subunit F
MLKKEDRIFLNLYGELGSDLASHKKRGDWDNTKDLIKKGRDWIIEEVKKSGLRGRGGAGFSTGMIYTFIEQQEQVFMDAQQQLIM